MRGWGRGTSDLEDSTEVSGSTKHLQNHLPPLHEPKGFERTRKNDQKHKKKCLILASLSLCSFKFFQSLLHTALLNLKVPEGRFRLIYKINKGEIRYFENYQFLCSASCHTTHFRLYDSYIFHHHQGPSQKLIFFFFFVETGSNQ